MTREESIKNLAKELEEMIINLLDSNLRSCLNCEHFKQIEEVCKLANSRPPARIIAKGCESWSYDQIPF